MDLDAGFEIARKVAARALEVGLPKDKPFVPLGQWASRRLAPERACEYPGHIGGPVSRQHVLSAT